MAAHNGVSENNALERNISGEERSTKYGGAAGSNRRRKAAETASAKKRIINEAYRRK